MRHEPTRHIAAAFLQHLEEVHDAAHDAFPALIPDDWEKLSADEQQMEFDRRGLHASQIELSGAVITLFRASRFAGVPALARVLLEVRVEIENTLLDPGYFKSRTLRTFQHVQRVMRGAAAGKNPRLAGLSQGSALAQSRPELERRIAELVREGVKSYDSVKARFEHAGLGYLYESVYAFQSHDSHADRLRLAAHNFSITDDGMMQLCIYQDQPQNFVGPVKQVAEDLSASALKLHRLRRSRAVQQLEAVDTRLNAFLAEFQ